MATISHFCSRITVNGYDTHLLIPADTQQPVTSANMRILSSKCATETLQDLSRLPATYELLWALKKLNYKDLPAITGYLRPRFFNPAVSICKIPDEKGAGPLPSCDDTFGSRSRELGLAHKLNALFYWKSYRRTLNIHRRRLYPRVPLLHATNEWTQHEDHVQDSAWRQTSD